MACTMADQLILTVGREFGSGGIPIDFSQILHGKT